MFLFCVQTEFQKVLKKVDPRLCRKQTVDSSLPPLAKQYLFILQFNCDEIVIVSEKN